AIFILFYIYYRPSLSKLKPKTIWLLIISGLIGASAMLFRFYGLRDAGITVTAVILILVPVIVFTSAAVYFHEKMKTKRVFAMLTIGALIIYATLVNYKLLTHK